MLAFDRQLSTVLPAGDIAAPIGLASDTLEYFIMASDHSLRTLNSFILAVSLILSGVPGIAASQSELQPAPPPEEHFGHTMGADGRLADWES